MARVNPGPVPVHIALMPHEAVDTGARQTPPRRHMWNSLDLHSRDHHVEEPLGNLHGHQDHGDLPLRHNRMSTPTKGHRPPCPRSLDQRDPLLRLLRLKPLLLSSPRLLLFLQALHLLLLRENSLPDEERQRRSVQAIDTGQDKSSEERPRGSNVTDRGCPPLRLGIFRTPDRAPVALTVFCAVGLRTCLPPPFGNCGAGFLPKPSRRLAFHDEETGVTVAPAALQRHQRVRSWRPLETKETRATHCCCGYP